MSAALVDSDVLLDVLLEDPTWFQPSAALLSATAERAVLVLNPIVLAETAVAFERIEDVDEALPPSMFRREPLPTEALFLAARCMASDRRSGHAGAALHELLIGAHAAVLGLPLLTRRASLYSRYFHRLATLEPEQP